MPRAECGKPLRQDRSKPLEKIGIKNMLSGEGDELTAIIQITAGAGGTESCDWASMLCECI